MGEVFSKQITPRWMKLASRTVKVGSGRHAPEIVVVGAAEYSGIGVKRLMQLVQDGLISGGPDPDSKRGDLIVDQDSIDAFRASQFGGSTIATEVNRLGRLGAR